MLSIKITSRPARSPSLGRQEIEIPCPRCGLHSWVSFAQVLRRDYAVCRGCHANLMLDDHMGTVKRAVRSFDRLVDSLLLSFS